MFTEFKSKRCLPVYEVIAPQTGQSFTVKSLTVLQEERLKTSMITPVKVVEHLDRCIFEQLDKKPANITDFDSFLKNVTCKDRDALLYGLSHCTYGDERVFELKCPNCGKSFSAKTSMNSCFDVKAYPGKDIFTKEIPLKMKFIEGVTAVIKQPTCYTELQRSKSTPSIYSNTSTSSETLIIDRFEDCPLESKEPIVYTETQDIIDAYLSLSPVDKRRIFKTYMKEFGQYQITLKMSAYCPKCGESSEYDLDLADNFFQMVYAVESDGSV